MKKNWFVIIILVLSGTLMVAQVLMMVFRNDNITDILRSGRIETYFNGDAVIIRDEKVITTSGLDFLAPAVPSGEKVSKGELIARSCNKTSEDILVSYEKAQQELTSEIKKSVLPVTSTSYEINNINKKINEKIYGLMLSNTNESFESALTFERDIRKLTDEKIKKVLDTLPSDSSLVDLKKKADALNKSFFASSGAVKSDRAGIVSFIVDGFEKKFTTAGIYNLKQNDIEGIKNVDSKVTDSKGKNSLKIIQNFFEYLAINVDTSFAESININALREIRINDVSQVLYGTLVIKKNGNSKKTLLVFKVDRGIEQTCDLRKVNIDIAKGRTRTSGLKVSRESLFKANYDSMEAEIALVRAHRVVFRKVDIVDFDGNYAIIIDSNKTPGKAVEVFEEYIKKPEQVKNKDVIQ